MRDHYDFASMKGEKNPYIKWRGGSAEVDGQHPKGGPERTSPMECRVVLIETDEGFAVSCPALKGCHSQGDTREEALENIRDAIREWLEAERAEQASRIPERF